MNNSHSFGQVLETNGLALTRLATETLQLNITKLCNQACTHCHVDSSPRRKEMMSDAVMSRCLEIMECNPSIKNLDITGGAPELHPNFKSLVINARKINKHVMVRHNLTVTLDPHPVTKESMRYLPDFFAEQGVEVISSLPYYQEYFTDRQRGQGVFGKSIESMKMLNERGYGQPDSGLVFNLVYNPVGTFLPAAQESLERDYKRELKEKFDLVFNHLYAITNMPINRFKAQLVKAGGYAPYMDKLVSAFTPQAALGVMCRSLISVSYDGKLYDCDFNQMLNMSLGDDVSLTVFDFEASKIRELPIKFASHCFGCTAGSGSSCGGATNAPTTSSGTTNQH
jgi:radical SAM/Cys-rich protein